MQDLEGKLRELRPSLFDVSKVEAHIILAYGIFNLLIGPVLITLPQSSLPIILPLPVWGLIYTALGVWMLTSLYLNEWQWAKASLLIGITIKTIWLIALILIAVKSNWAVALLWSVFTWIQIICYVFFPGNGHVKR